MTNSIRSRDARSATTTRKARDRALSDGDAFAGAREGEFTNDEIDALRQALSIAKQELNARDEQLREARDDAGKMRETAIKAAKELAKEQRKRKAAGRRRARGVGRRRAKARWWRLKS